ncbi:MAG TPA: hypothetical protein VHL56_00785 [Candidatus Limnocylindrales bacterium]|nr:hypothetical protein [Candidatus Limnocylindrales bacterium]
MSNRRAPRTLSALLAATVLVGACTTTPPSPSPAPTAAPATPSVTATPLPTGTPRPLAEVYGDIRTQVEAIRGLQPTAAVDPVVIDAGQLAKNLAKEFDSTHTDAGLKDAEDELITLGLLPAGSSLRAITLAFQGGQVAGYYSPEANELFVVNRSGAVGPVDESTYAHEFTHQLQDQHFDLDKLGIDVSDQSDRSLARLALVEGDATSAQTTWMTDHLSSAEMGQVFAAGLDPEAMKAFNEAPFYLQQTSLFPYQSGLVFVMRLISQGGYAAVDAAFADPPDSTEQVLHPDKYLTREAPIDVKIPAGVAKKLGTGWTEVGQDTMGEMLIGTWLKLGGVAPVDANRAAAGWGGDRLGLYRKADGTVALGLITTWDSDTDAVEFYDAATAALEKLGKTGDVRLHATDRTTIVVAIGPNSSDLVELLGAGPVGVGG